MLHGIFSWGQMLSCRLAQKLKLPLRKQQPVSTILQTMSPEMVDVLTNGSAAKYKPRPAWQEGYL